MAFTADTSPGENRYRAYRVRSAVKSVIEPEEVFVDASVFASPDTAIRGSQLELPLTRSAARRFIGLILLTLLGLAGYAGYLALPHGDEYRALAEANRVRSYITRAPRGIIYDRFLQPLVENKVSFDALVTPIDLPRNLSERNALIHELAAVLHMSEDDIAGTIERAGVFSPHPVLLKRRMNHDEVVAMETRNARLPGVRVKQNTYRAYPYGAAIAHVLGYTGLVDAETLASDPQYSVSDEIGKAGVEIAYEKLLKGRNGVRRIERTAEGKNLSESLAEPGVAGNNIVLAIDANLQARLYTALDREQKKLHAKGGAAVAIDPSNGNIRALVSVPSYDNNVFVSGGEDEDLEALLRAQGQPLFNRAITGIYPGGSTMKLFVAAGVLMEKIIDPLRRIPAPGAIQIANEYNPGVIYTFRDWKPHGTVNLPEAIARSSNVYFYTVGGGYNGIKGLGVERIAAYFGKFGFGSLLGIDLPGEAPGRVPTPQWKEETKHEPWYTGDTYHLAIGQGDLAVTPLHLATAVSAIANGGTLYKPQLVERMLNGDDEKGERVPPEVVRDRIADPAALTIIRQGMREAVTAGTARGLARISVPLAAKTGTAQPGGGKKPHSWIVVFGPYEKPELVLAVLLEEGGEGSGGALTVARETLQWYFGSPRSR